jgi:hypothetical protein
VTAVDRALKASVCRALACHHNCRWGDGSLEPRPRAALRPPLVLLGLAVAGLEVPQKLCVRPFVVSVTVTSVKTTVIGGVQSGWNVAVTMSVKSALPF